MKFTVADLLDQLSSDEVVQLSKLEKALGLSSAEEKQELRIGLDAMIRLDLVQEKIGRAHV